MDLEAVLEGLMEASQAFLPEWVDILGSKDKEQTHPWKNIGTSRPWGIQQYRGPSIIVSLAEPERQLLSSRP